MTSQFNLKYKNMQKYKQKKPSNKDVYSGNTKVYKKLARYLQTYITYCFIMINKLLAYNMFLSDSCIYHATPNDTQAWPIFR